MPANECIPLFEDADRLTINATAPIKGKRFVAPSQNFTSGPGIPTAAQVGASDPVDGSNINAEHCPAGARPLGVSTWDLPVIGEKGGCITEGVVPVTAAENLLAGEEVEVGPEGKAAKVTAASGAAVLKTGVVANKNAIQWTAAKPGSLPKIVLKVAGANTPLSVTVAGSVVTVNVATNAGSEAISTAQEAINAVNENAEASALVMAANAETSSGTGVVAAVAETALAGTTVTANGSAGLTVSGALSGEDVYVKLHC